MAVRYLVLQTCLVGDMIVYPGQVVDTKSTYVPGPSLQATGIPLPPDNAYLTPPGVSPPTLAHGL